MEKQPEGHARSGHRLGADPAKASAGFRWPGSGDLRAAQPPAEAATPRPEARACLIGVDLQEHIADAQGRPLLMATTTSTSATPAMIAS
jgi:hypothetical protein